MPILWCSGLMANTRSSGSSWGQSHTMSPTMVPVQSRSSEGKPLASKEDPMQVGALKECDSMAILQRSSLGRLGCVDHEAPYVVPVNYLFDGQDIYIHSLPGRKIDAMRTNSRVCLQVDEIKDAFHWQSVIAFGNYEEIEDEGRREEILAKLFRRLPHMTPVETQMSEGLNETILFRIKVAAITGVGENW